MKVCGKNVFNELDYKKVKKVYLSKNFNDSEILKKIKDNHLNYVFTEPKSLDKMLGHNQGIICDILDYEYYDVDDIKDENFIVVLDHLSDPHNFGAIIRTCEARGIKSIIIPKDRSVLVNETVMKTSTGALEHIKIILVSNLANTIRNLKKKGYFVYSAEAGGVDYKSVDYAEKKILIVGSEGDGVAKNLINESDYVISIPMKGVINSLNASVAAAILIYGIGD